MARHRPEVALVGTEVHQVVLPVCRQELDKLCSSSGFLTSLLDRVSVVVQPILLVFFASSSPFSLSRFPPFSLPSCSLLSPILLLFVTSLLSVLLSSTPKGLINLDLYFFPIISPLRFSSDASPSSFAHTQSSARVVSRSTRSERNRNARFESPTLVRPPCPAVPSLRTSDSLSFKVRR